MILPFSIMDNPEASIVAPVFDGVSIGLVVTWSGTVAHAPSQVEYGNQVNICG